MLFPNTTINPESRGLQYVYDCYVSVHISVKWLYGAHKDNRTTCHIGL